MERCHHDTPRCTGTLDISRHHLETRVLTQPVGPFQHEGEGYDSSWKTPLHDDRTIVGESSGISAVASIDCAAAADFANDR